MNDSYGYQNSSNGDVTLWDPDYINFKHELETFLLDWRTKIHWIVVPTNFQQYNTCQLCCKNVATKSLFSNPGDKVLKSWKTMGQICPVLSTRVRTLSPGLENNSPMKCCFDDFETKSTLWCCWKIVRTTIQCIIVFLFKGQISNSCLDIM